VVKKYRLTLSFFLFQVDPKFLRNQRFAKKHNKKAKEGKAEEKA